jgi:soluble lytic murein transglycosylase-like protein
VAWWATSAAVILAAGLGGSARRDESPVTRSVAFAPAAFVETSSGGITAPREEVVPVSPRWLDADIDSAPDRARAEARQRRIRRQRQRAQRRAERRRERRRAQRRRVERRAERRAERRRERAKAEARAPQYGDSLTETIYAAANEFGLDGDYLLSVAACESDLDPGAVNEVGYYGLFQFDEPTWAAYGYGSIWDPIAQSRTAARLLAAGEAERWLQLPGPLSQLRTRDYARGALRGGCRGA